MIHFAIFLNCINVTDKFENAEWRYFGSRTDSKLLTLYLKSPDLDLFKETLQKISDYSTVEVCFYELEASINEQPPNLINRQHFKFINCVIDDYELRKFSAKIAIKYSDRTQLMLDDNFNYKVFYNLDHGEWRRIGDLKNGS